MRITYIAYVFYFYGPRSDRSTVYSIVVKFFSVNTITHEPLHSAC